jgi:hypothetical protein
MAGAAGLRAPNGRLRELLAQRDAEIARLRAQVAELQEQAARGNPWIPDTT